MNKNILIAVIGLNPDIILSSLSSFKVEQKKQFDEIFVITTFDGKKGIQEKLFANDVFKNFKSSYRITTIFNESNIIVPKKQNGELIKKIVNEEEQEVFFKACFELVKEIVKDEKNVAHFLITGGMKGMSNALMLSMQLLGRDFDVCYNISRINKETILNFANLPQYLKKQIEKEEDYYSLIKFPFVRLHSPLKAGMLSNLDIEKLILNTTRKKYKVKIIKKTREIKINDDACVLSPSLFAFYLFFIYKNVNCRCKKNTCKECKDYYVSLYDIFNNNEDEFLNLYNETKKGSYKLSNTGISEISKENFNSYKSKIKQIFSKTFNIYVVNEISIDSINEKKQKKYGIRLSKDMIEII